MAKQKTKKTNGKEEETEQKNFENELDDQSSSIDDTEESAEDEQKKDAETAEEEFQSLDDYEKGLEGKPLESFRFWRRQFTKRQQKKIFFCKMKEVCCPVCNKNDGVFRTTSGGIVYHFKCRPCDFPFKAIKKQKQVTLL